MELFEDESLECKNWINLTKKSLGTKAIADILKRNSYLFSNQTTYARILYGIDDDAMYLTFYQIIVLQTSTNSTEYIWVTYRRTAYIYIIIAIILPEKFYPNEAKFDINTSLQDICLAQANKFETEIAYNTAYISALLLPQRKKMCLH